MMPGEYTAFLEAECESPIEMKLAEAIFDEATSINETFIPGRSWTHNFAPLPERQPLTWLHHQMSHVVDLQHRIEPYRIDIVVGAIYYNCESDADSDNGINEFLRKLPPIAIECDGHDFHEKTKEQAQRDKERDRFIQAKGYRILRFTGSEIHRDAQKCAREVFDLFNVMLREYK